MNRRWLALLRVGVIAVTVSAGACQSEPDAAPSTTAASGTSTTAAPTKPASPLLDDPAAVLTDPLQILPRNPRWPAVAEGYARAEQAMLRAQLDPVDPDDPNLAATIHGEVLENTQASLRSIRESGEAYRSPEAFQLRVMHIEVDRNLATINVCYTLDSDLISVASGDTLEGGVFSFEVGASLELTGSGWVMTGRKTWPERHWEGKADCAGA